MFVALMSIYAFMFPNNIEIKKLQKEFNILASSIQNETYYEVVRTVNIRDYPNSSKEIKILDVVFPKQKLLLLDRKSKWIEIEYFSNKKQETVTGWVYKKYTKKLNSSSIQETAHLMQSSNNASRLNEAIEQLETGFGQSREWIEE